MKNILSENINISFNSRETGINNNVFLCGSSNNRTSFLESNIFQMNGSYIVSDYKGILYKDTQSVMRKNGYDVKFLDFKDFNKQSNHYNPFTYFNSDNDISIYVNHLFNGILQTSTDYINDAERAFARFLFMYVFHIGVEDDNGVLQHNMAAVLKLLFEGIHNVADRGYSIDYMFLCVESLAEFEGNFDMFNGLCDSFICTDLHDSITSEKIKLIIPGYKKFSYRFYIKKFAGIYIDKKVTLLSKLPCIKKDECIVIINRVGAFKDKLYKLGGIENETTNS